MTRSYCVASSSSARWMRAASDTDRSLYAPRMAEATPLGTESRSTRAGARPELRRGGRPAARAVRHRHRLRHPRACTRSRSTAASRPRTIRHVSRAARAGRGVHGRRLRARRRQARRLRADHGRRADERRDADRGRLPRLDPAARSSPAPPLARQRPRARRAARPARPARVHGHHHGRVDRGPRPGRAARRVRPGVRDLRVAAAAARAHRHPDRRARPARRRLGAAAGARRAAGRRSPRWSSAPSSCSPPPSARCCCSAAAPWPPAPRPPRSPSGSARRSA